ARQEFLCRRRHEWPASFVRKRSDFGLRMGEAIDVGDPRLGQAYGAAEGPIPGAADAVALGADLQADLADAAAGIKTLVLVSHGRDAGAGEERDGYGPPDVMTLDKLHASVLTPALGVFDEGLEFSGEPGRVFDGERQLPSQTQGVAQ